MKKLHTTDYYGAYYSDTTAEAVIVYGLEEGEYDRLCDIQDTEGHQALCAEFGLFDESGYYVPEGATIHEYEIHLTPITAVIIDTASINC